MTVAELKRRLERFEDHMIIKASVDCDERDDQLGRRVFARDLMELNPYHDELFLCFRVESCNFVHLDDVGLSEP